MGKQLAFIWLGVWAVLYAMSFILAANTAPKDMGFTRGLNRVTTFFGWQMAAAVVGVLVFAYAQHAESGLWRWLLRMPVILAGALLAFVVLLVVGANFMKPNPDGTLAATNRPVTAPAVPAEGENHTYSGYYRQGFEQSEFYTLDGQGPYWLAADEDVWEQLQSHQVPAAGRGSSITLKMTIEGDLTHGEFGHLGAYDQRLYVRRIMQIEQLTSEEYDKIIQGF